MPRILQASFIPSVTGPSDAALEARVAAAESDIVAIDGRAVTLEAVDTGQIIADVETVKRDALTTNNDLSDALARLGSAEGRSTVHQIEAYNVIRAPWRAGNKYRMITYPVGFQFIDFDDLNGERDKTPIAAPAGWVMRHDGEVIYWDALLSPFFRPEITRVRLRGAQREYLLCRAFADAPEAALNPSAAGEDLWCPS